MAVLIVLAGFVVPLLRNVINAAISGTNLSLYSIRDAISGTTSGTTPQAGYAQDMGSDPLTIANLFVALTGMPQHTILSCDAVGMAPILQNATEPTW